MCMAPLQKRNYVVMELRGNLSKETRTASLAQFFDSSFKHPGKTAKISKKLVLYQTGSRWFFWVDIFFVPIFWSFVLSRKRAFVVMGTPDADFKKKNLEIRGSWSGSWQLVQFYHGNRSWCWRISRSNLMHSSRRRRKRLKWSKWSHHQNGMSLKVRTIRTQRNIIKVPKRKLGWCWAAGPGSPKEGDGEEAKGNRKSQEKSWEGRSLLKM